MVDDARRTAAKVADDTGLDHRAPNRIGGHVVVQPKLFEHSYRWQRLVGGGLWSQHECRNVRARGQVK
jgi:hypothetical protein